MTGQNRAPRLAPLTEAETADVLEILQRVDARLDRIDEAMTRTEGHYEA